MFILCGQYLSAQDEGHIEHDHDHHDHHHHHHKNEIGFASAPVYFVNEKEFSYGIHIHYVRTIKDSKFGIGLGYERIFDEHKHNTIGIVGSYRPTENFGINISPGITFEDGEESSTNFAIHLEASYEFAINNIHLGPVLELAYDPEDYHISLGFHIGYGF
jgi:hypothetical protein